MGRVQHIHMVREGLVQRVVPQHPAEFQHLRVRLVRRILQNPPGQHIVLKISRVQLGAQRSVHIEHGDPVRQRNKVRRGFVRHAFHILDQGLQGRSFLVPLLEKLLTFIFRNSGNRHRQQHCQGHQGSQ